MIIITILSRNLKEMNLFISIKPRTQNIRMMEVQALPVSNVCNYNHNVNILSIQRTKFIFFEVIIGDL